MYILLVALHIFVSLVLIAVILLQAGRGGGIADVFGGGGATQQIFGVRASTFLTRATSACAIIFILTSLSLTLVSAARSHSLLAPTGRVQGHLPSSRLGGSTLPTPTSPAESGDVAPTQASTPAAPATSSGSAPSKTP